MIEQMLDQLAEFEAERDLIAVRKQEAIDAILTDEIREQLAFIDAEFDPLYAPVDEHISILTAGIKAAVIEHGASVKGQYKHAVLTPEKVTAKYNTEALDGYAATHPEILPFRKEEKSKASVSIRTVK